MSSIPGSCPSPEELGNAGWTILHTAAAVFPNAPSPSQQQAMRDFIYSWSQVYACSYCAYHMRRGLVKHPPVVTSKREVSRYVCEMHNRVNRALGKDEYDCNPENVLRRWHPSYPHMDDIPPMEVQIEEEQRRASARNTEAPGTAQSTEKWKNWGWSGREHTRTTTMPNDETNVDAVLRRLKGCQVYCPEKNEKK